MPHKAIEQQGEAVFEVEVFAVAGDVLPDEGNFTHATGPNRSASAITDSKRRRLKQVPRTGRR